MESHLQLGKRIICPCLLPCIFIRNLYKAKYVRIDFDVRLILMVLLENLFSYMCVLVVCCWPCVVGPVSLALCVIGLGSGEKKSPPSLFFVIS